jgi:hypothetical protein
MTKEKRLKFLRKDTENELVVNSENQLLGRIQRKRVGRFMHWTFQPVPIEKLGDLWFTNGCMKEISEEITSLYKRGRT